MHLTCKTPRYINHKRIKNNHYQFEEQLLYPQMVFWSISKTYTAPERAET